MKLPNHHGQTKRPTSSPSIHNSIADEIAGQLDQSWQEKAEILVAAHRWADKVKANVDHLASEPIQRYQQSFKPHIWCSISIYYKN